MGMEAFNDTPIVNGTAYPTTTVDPKAYRFRILNAANDRFCNLSLVRRRSHDRDTERGRAERQPRSRPPRPIRPSSPTPDTTKSPAGPNWIQIGTEGGFLPAPVVVPAQPTTWITDPRRFDVGNVDKHSLLLAPAERADVIVDFSKYAGQDADPVQRRPGGVPGPRSALRLLHRWTGPDRPVGAPTHPARIRPEHPHRHADQGVHRRSASRFDRLNHDDRMGALNAAFAHHADGSGVFESGRRIRSSSARPPTTPPTARASSRTATAAPDRSATREMRRLRPDSRGCTGRRIRVRHPGPKAQTDHTVATQGHARRDGLGQLRRMRADDRQLGLEAPGATPLRRTSYLYPLHQPGDRDTDSTG